MKAGKPWRGCLPFRLCARFKGKTRCKGTVQCGKRGERRGAGRFVHLKLAQAGDEKEQTDGNYRRLNHPVSVPVKKGAEADQSWDEMEKNAGIHVYE